MWPAAAAPTRSEKRERHRHHSQAEHERLCPDELVPAQVTDRLIDGEPPLRVWREYRGLSQSALSRAAETSRIQIVDIEPGRATGSVQTLRKLADALGFDCPATVCRVLRQNRPRASRTIPFSVLAKKLRCSMRHSTTRLRMRSPNS